MESGDAEQGSATSPITSEISDNRSERSDKSSNIDSSSDEEDGERYGEGVWDAETEIALFESISKLPPIGMNRYFSVLNSSIYMKKRARKHFTTPQVMEHVKELYNLDALDDIDPEIVAKDFELPVDDFGSMMEERLAARSERKPEVKSEFTDVDMKVETDENDNMDEDEGKSTKKRKKDEKEKAGKPPVVATDQESLDTVVEKSRRGRKPSIERSSTPASPSSTASSPGTFKFATFSEFIVGALEALGGSADLQSLYIYVAEHQHDVSSKYASRFDKSGGYKSNVRSTLHNNQIFTKDSSTGLWTISSSYKKPHDKK